MAACSRRPKPAAWAPPARFLIGVARGKLSRPEIRRSLLQAVRTAAAVLTVLIGALLFGYFLTVTQTPQKVTEFLTGLGLGRYGVLALIMLMYIVLGCLMDALAMIILTIPIIFPVITQLGFDPIWFGVIIVMTVELGLIHPPVGMNVFVIKSVVQDVSFSTIFLGVMPFIVTDLIRLVILIAFPVLALCGCRRIWDDARLHSAHCHARQRASDVMTRDLLLSLTPPAAGEHRAGGAVGPEIVDAVDGEEIGQPGAGAIDAALDGADRAAADRRGVVIGEAGGAHQDQRFALIRRQLRQRRAELFEFDPPGLLGMRFQRLGITAVGILDFAAPFAVFGAEQVAQRS